MKGGYDERRNNGVRERITQIMKEVVFYSMPRQYAADLIRRTGVPNAVVLRLLGDT